MTFQPTDGIKAVSASHQTVCVRTASCGLASETIRLGGRRQHHGSHPSEHLFKIRRRESKWWTVFLPSHEVVEHAGQNWTELLFSFAYILVAHSWRSAWRTPYWPAGVFPVIRLRTGLASASAAATGSRRGPAGAAGTGAAGAGAWGLVTSCLPDPLALPCTVKPKMRSAFL